MTALSLFADEMKAAREQRGWSQADLAEKIPTACRPSAWWRRCTVPARDLARHWIRFGTRDLHRLEARLRDLPFPASFRPFAAYERRQRRCTCSSTAWFPAPATPLRPAVLATRPNTAEDEVDNLWRAAGAAGHPDP